MSPDYHNERKVLDDQWERRKLRGYQDATIHPWRWVLAGVVGLALIVLGGWQAHWWFATQNENNRAHLLRHSFGFQDNLRTDITKNIGNVLSIKVQIAQSASDPGEQAQLRAQAKGILAIVCGDAVQVTGDPLPPSQDSFVNTNCEAGNVSPSSPYNQGTNP